MEALMGPFYGLLCATDPHMELCPHWVFDLLHRIPKVPKWTDTPRFSYVVSFYWASLGLIATPLNPKVMFSYGYFSHLGVLVIFEGPFGSFL